MLKSKSAIGPVVASALLLVVAVVAVIGFQTWFSGFSSGVFTKTELQSNSDETIQIEKIIGNTVYLKNSKNTTISLSKLKVGSIDCNVNQNLSYGVTGIDISSCLAQITSKSQNIVAYTNKAVISKDVYISDWDSTTPYLSLSSNWTTIPYNTSVNLSWSGNNLNTCTASGAWSGSKSTSNSEVISNLITNSTFTLDCTSSSVNVSKSVDVIVTDLPIITFSAENSSISFNSSTNLVWSVANADTCTASGNWSGSKATSGTYNTTNLDVSGNHSYTLTCNGFGGESSSTINIEVGSDVTQVVIASSIFNYNLVNDLVANYSWDGVTPLNVEVTINSGVIIGSTSTSTAAFTTGNFPSGSSVTIINNGRIQGKGGNGGYGLYNNAIKMGEKGGDALEINVSTILNNSNGEIWSGGGGGGGGGNQANTAGGGGGGGGAGTNFGDGGGDPGVFKGYAGSELVGGARHQSYPYYSGICPSGKGGDPGQAGEDGLYQSGTCNYTSGPGAGGAAGDSIQTNGNSITWLGGNSSPNLKGPIN